MAALAPWKLLDPAVDCALIAITWFAACWAIGWVLAGFARDKERPV